MKNRKVLLLAAAALVVLVAGASLLYPRLAAKTETGELAPQGETVDSGVEVEEKEEPKGVKAPDFTAYDREGDPVKLSDYFGTPIVLNFWASWCPPCQGEMPEFEQMWQKYEGRVQFLMVNQTDGSRETVQTALEFVDRGEYTFPVLLDSGLQGAYAYGVNALPMTFFIDAEGNLITYAAGGITASVIELGISMICTEE